LSVTDDVKLFDAVGAERAAAQLLAALGVDRESRMFAETPRRMVEALHELIATHEFEMTTFPNVEDYTGLVLARSIPFRALCEHHLLPFYGVAHTGYLPGDRVLGLSKLARVVEACSRGFQMQERMTEQIGLYLMKHLAPRGVGVVVEGIHTCMTIRGIRATGVTTTTYSFHGELNTVAELRAEFFGMVRAESTTPFTGRL
jgi:GTP cyclohydrolase IA